MKDIEIDTLQLCFTNLSSKNTSEIRNLSKSILTRVKNLSLTIEELNTVEYDSTYEVDQEMRVGELLVSPGTLICIDETSMNEGKLNEKGTRNIFAIKKFLEEGSSLMKNTYFESNLQLKVRVVLFCELKSLFEVDIMYSDY